MANSLERLEGQLRGWIEANADRMGGSAQFSAITRALLSVVEEHLTDPCFTSQVTPVGLVIHVAPDSYKNLSKEKDLLPRLTHALQQFILENSVDLASKPLISLRPDPKLKKGEIKVTIEKPAPLSDTAAIPVSALAHPAGQFQNSSSRSFLLIEGERSFPLDCPIVNVGRQADNTLVIQDPRVSRHHAQLRCINGDVVISDLNSSGGTFVNAKRITQHTLLPGDVISLAGFPLIFGKSDSSHQDPTMPMPTKDAER